jgi:antitoxin YefM
MIHVSASDLRKNLAHFMDRAEADRDPILVTRQGSEPVVILAHSEFESMMETLYLRRSPANAAALNASIAQAEAGELVSFELPE